MIRIFFVALLMISLNGFSQDSFQVEETRGLQVGDTVDLFTASDQNDSTFVLGDALENGAVVLIFYRGQWCPYCSRHLSNIQDNMEELRAKGATVIAVSPENQEHLQMSAEKNKVEFTLLFDQDYSIAKSFDVLFEPTSSQIKKYNFIGADFQNAHSNETTLLPVPATFIINKKGVIVWRHFEHSYKERASVVDILDHL
ncbi:MAG: peroxiredoxin [Crocinitomicaceae bacterium]|jgi:peroxiredoxin